jgi:cyclopropane-fatty-acyl-phospholipid synthase
LAKRILIHRLQPLKHGTLTLIDGDQSLTFGEANRLSALADIHVTLTIKDAQFYGEVVFAGSIGAGEAYMRDLYDCDNLTNLIRLMVRNQSLLDGIESGWAKLTTPIQALLHRLNKNTQQGSRRNISAHYDLGNDFFKLMLDPTMMYSSGIFSSAKDSLEQASLNKLKSICKKLDLKPPPPFRKRNTIWLRSASPPSVCKITSPCC